MHSFRYIASLSTLCACVIASQPVCAQVKGQGPQSQRTVATPLLERFTQFGKNVIDAVVLDIIEPLSVLSVTDARSVERIASTFRLNDAVAPQGSVRIVPSESELRVRFKNGLQLHCEVDSRQETAAKPELAFNFALSFDFR